MIQFLRVGRAVAGRLVPRRASFEVKSGELVRVAGPSGSGQSLLVRMALGRLAPTTGTVMVNGTNPYKLSPASRQGLRRLLGSVLDDEAPLEVPVDAWVALGAWCAGRAWPPALTAAREALERAGLARLAGDGFARTGRADRFALALVRALLRKPHAILIDWRDPGAPPAALREELDAYLTGGGAVLMTGDGREGEWPVPTRVERLDPSAVEPLLPPVMESDPPGSPSSPPAPDPDPSGEPAS